MPAKYVSAVASAPCSVMDMALEKQDILIARIFCMAFLCHAVVLLRGDSSIGRSYYVNPDANSRTECIFEGGGSESRQVRRRSSRHTNDARG